MRRRAGDLDDRVDERGRPAVTDLTDGDDRPRFVARAFAPTCWSVSRTAGSAANPQQGSDRAPRAIPAVTENQKPTRSVNWVWLLATPGIQARKPAYVRSSPSCGPCSRRRGGCAARPRAAHFFGRAWRPRAKSLAAMPFGCKREAESDDLEPEADVVARGAQRRPRDPLRD